VKLIMHSLLSFQVLGSFFERSEFCFVYKRRKGVKLFGLGNGRVGTSLHWMNVWMVRSEHGKRRGYRRLRRKGRSGI